jgi:hypothetical protein
VKNRENKVQEKKEKKRESLARYTERRAYG